MENLNPSIVLIFLGLIFITVELFLGVATGFDLLIAGIIFIISGIAGWTLNSFNISLSLVIALSFLYIVLGRKFVKSKLSIATKATNTNALMEKKGIVIKKITPDSPGQVKVEGEIWRAEASRSIDEGTEVVVQSVSGVTLKVS
ncbi:MAG: NfeD family protein [Candidatus Roizmanbacteria bacterium]|nr:MAG: NfeD family protein [Candidatus Roizmanbacteria bacterium]